MMGTKERAFQPLAAVSLESLAPADHFYRHLETKLDLSFARDLVAERYSSVGRPSIDPVVFFKLQLCISPLKNPSPGLAGRTKPPRATPAALPAQQHAPPARCRLAGDGPESPRQPLLSILAIIDTGQTLATSNCDNVLGDGREEKILQCRGTIHQLESTSGMRSVTCSWLRSTRLAGQEDLGVTRPIPEQTARRTGRERRADICCEVLQPVAEQMRRGE